jgi:hypothetical protein
VDGVVQDLAQGWLDVRMRRETSLARVAAGVTTVVAVLLAVLGAGAAGVLSYLSKKPGSMPDFAKRRKVQSACGLIVVAAVVGLVFLGPAR